MDYTQNSTHYVEIEGLTFRSPAAEDDCFNGYTFWTLPVRVHDRALISRGTEPETARSTLLLNIEMHEDNNLIV